MLHSFTSHLSSTVLVVGDVKVAEVTIERFLVLLELEAGVAMDAVETAQQLVFVGRFSALQFLQLLNAFLRQILAQLEISAQEF